MISVDTIAGPSAGPSGPTEVAAAVDLARLMATAASRVEAMRVLTGYAAAVTPAADAVGLTIPTGSGFTTRAATAPVAEAVDALQYRFGGPCVDVLTDPEPVLHLRDIPAEGEDVASRWHRFAAAAYEQTPVRSLLSFRLHVEPDAPVVSLNLYASTPNAFTDETIAATTQLLTPAALALAYRSERQTRLELETALESNRKIGAAVGVLMARQLVDYDTAFTLLRRASQHTNRKLRDIADDVLTAGELPHITARQPRLVPPPDPA